MPAPIVSPERAEAEAVLASGILAKSPNLERFFRYAMEHHFSGTADQIKEYNIAVEAFGRPATFDPKTDSIVRVEAYRLRRRLARYYAKEGFGHEVEIHFPSGQYAPEFRSRSGEDRPQPEATRPMPPAKVRWKWVAAAALGTLFFGAGLLTWRRPPAAIEAARPVAPAAASGDAVRILAGAQTSYVDHAGNTWEADRYFRGGTSRTLSPRLIRRTYDRGLFLNWREGDFSYDIPLAPGVYELRLYFVEPQYGEESPGGGGEASRFFSIYVNGKPLVNALDVVSDAGGGLTADVKVFKDIEPGQDGALHLAFVSLVRDKAILSAIEVVRGTRGRMLPLRIVMGPRAARDSRGGVWLPDRYASGGLVLERQDPVQGTRDNDLYRHERFGNFSYAIPVAAGGRYSAVFHFSEHFFGEGRPGTKSRGARVFDVYCNGRALLENFDLLSAAPPLHAVQRTFRGLTPNAQGKLVFQFVPVANYPLVNAIEIVDES